MPAQTTPQHRLVEWLFPVTAIFLLSRTALLLVCKIAAIDIPVDSPLANPSVLRLLCRWDCGWYNKIAEHGYTLVDSASQTGATTFAFYPLLPLLMRLAAPLFQGNVILAAIILTNACFLAALVYIYCYARLLGLTGTAALLATAMLSILPQSIAFSAVMTESPFLLLVVMAMYYTKREKFLIAGVCAALLSATRANGVFFVVFVVVWIARTDGWRAFLYPWRRPEIFVPIVLAPLGAFLFWGYCLLATGDAFAHPSTELHGWGWYFDAPWRNLPAMLRTEGPLGIAAAFSLPVFACSCLLLRQRRYEEFALCAALILLVWSGQTQSVFRYWLVTFPIWIALSDWLESRPVWSALTFATLALFNGMLTYAWTLQKAIAI